ncbi:hypothetical protein [Amycolatopsis sp. NPDC059657]|uniref:hypothetical protein n=1 Tax=Amycolatopsis sp. NPDC059657 TaxID=3346899 RepID=UPI00366D5215
MTSSARDRRLRLLQEKKAKDAAGGLAGSARAGSFPRQKFPIGRMKKLAHVRRTTAEPDEVLSESVDEAEIRSWEARFVVNSPVGELFYLPTGIELFPWLDCELDTFDLLNLLFDRRGFGLTFVANAFDSAVLFYEEEPEYQAYLVTESHRWDEAGKLL